MKESPLNLQLTTETCQEFGGEVEQHEMFIWVRI